MLRIQKNNHHHLLKELFLETDLAGEVDILRGSARVVQFTSDLNSQLVSE